MSLLRPHLALWHATVSGPTAWRRAHCGPLLLVAALHCLSAPLAPAQTAKDDPAVPAATAHCDVWFIDARAECGCPPAGHTPNLRFFQYSAGAWSPSNLDAFVAGSRPEVPTVFWVHGNRIEYGEANYVGWTVYEQLASAAGKPMRFVIWSWPAAQIRGLRADLQTKAIRADNGGYALAWVVSHLPPEQPVGLIGYSYGARLLAGSLHLLGGGQIGQASLPSLPPRTGGTRAVMWAAALDAGALAPWGYRGQALHAVDELLLTVNGADRVLKWYPRLWGRGGPDALGYVGPLGLEDWSKIRWMDVSGLLGRTHDWEAYVFSQGIMSATAQTALAAASPADEAAQETTAP